jgi:hypothetical protein
MMTGLGPSDATMQGITSPLATLTETMTASYMLTAAREDKKANGFNKLGAHHQQMIQNASMIDVHLPVTEPILSLVVFLDLKTPGQATNHLKYELQNNFGLNF